MSGIFKATSNRVFDNNIFHRRISQSELCFQCYLANFGVMYNTQTKWQILYGFKRNRRISVVWQFLFSTPHGLQLKKKWKCDSEELFERKLVVYFVLHYSPARIIRKEF